MGVVFGIQCGTLVWGVLTASGVTALLTASHLAYEIVRWAGAVYLIWMGLSMLWAPRAAASPPQPATRITTSATRSRPSTPSIPSIPSCLAGGGAC